MKIINVINGNGSVVPYEMVKQHEAQIMSNHGQTIDQICDRGGLDWVELYCVLSDIPFDDRMSIETAKTKVLNKIDRFNNTLMTRLIKAEKLGLRPCMVKCLVDGKRADKIGYFHRWSEERQIINPSILNSGHQGGIISGVVALVELEDGSIVKCNPSNLKFTD